MPLTEEGARKHAAWEQNHPYLTMAGNVAGATPFVVAVTPFATVAGDAVAASTVGQGMTSVLTNPYFNAAVSSAFAAHGA